jgi:2-keto-4-pentenoate hydratase/2-oxohepta-3-ene-1,7-dioic acid hydratase in catechol pathway
VPKFSVAHESADYESELGVVLSKDCKDVSEEEAMDYVLGYSR